MFKVIVNLKARFYTERYCRSSYICLAANCKIHHLLSPLGRVSFASKASKRRERSCFPIALQVLPLYALFTSIVGCADTFPIGESKKDNISALRLKRKQKSTKKEPQSQFLSFKLYPVILSSVEFFYGMRDKRYVVAYPL